MPVPHSTSLRLVLLLSAVLASCASSPNELVVRISKGDDAGKSDAIVELGALLAAKDASSFPFSDGDREALGLLRDVALQDLEPLHRMLAISALKGLSRFDHLDVYLEGLESTYWGVRLEAAKALVVHPDPRALARIVERTRRESNRVVLVDLVKALVEYDDRETLRTLLTMFLDVTGRYEDHQLKIYDAVRRLSGKSWAITQRTLWRELLDGELATDEVGPKSAEPSGGGS